MGYEWFERKLKINHLFFMDDIKLFGKSQNQIDLLVNTVYLLSSDIGMEFGIGKCGVLVMQRGKVIATERMELPDGQVMKDIEEKGYKYLRILEMDKIKEVEMKEAFTTEYHRRLGAGVGLEIEWQERNHCNKHMGCCSFTIWSEYTKVGAG